MRIHFLIYGQNRSVTRASGWLVQFGNVEPPANYSERSQCLLLRT